MNSTLINSNPSVPNQSDASHAAPSIKVLVFNICNLNLGLRIESVYKVLNSTQIHRSASNWLGIAHMGDRSVTVLDLQQKLFQFSNNNESENIGYLVVIQNKAGELYGIPVEAVPALIDIPLSTIRVLPESFRQADTLGIASHVAVLTEADNSLTLFLLDIESTTKISG